MPLHFSFRGAGSIVAAWLLSSLTHAHAEKASRLIATAPSGAYRVVSVEGELYVEPAKSPAKRAQLPLPPKPAGQKAGPATSADDENPSWPRAFISPDDRWIYAEEYDAAPARLYHRVDPANAGELPQFELVENFLDRAKTFFAGEAKSPKLHVERTEVSFAAWSPDSARLMLSFNFYAASPEAAPLASFASNWLCYYDTSSGAFELTDRLRAADKGKIDLTLKAQNLPRDRPVLSAEALGKEGPETPAKERFAKADAQLNQVYAQLLQQLAPDAKTQLRQEERSWLNERETFAWIHAGQMWSPFPEASHVEGQALATETRVAELRKRLDPNGAPAAAGATAEAPAGPVNFSGRYEPVKPLPGTTFELNVEQSPAGATISFSAAQNNGGGAAPDGDGQGQVNDAGVLTFTFQDSFANEGKGTLKAGKSGYTLQMEVTKVADARCLKYYGTMELRKAKK